MAGKHAIVGSALTALAYGHPGGPTKSDTTIQVDKSVTYQGYDGIGCSEAFQRSLVLHELDTPSQNLALDLLFSNKTGAGMTILRNGLGSSPVQHWDWMKSIAPEAPASNSSAVSKYPVAAW